MFHKPQIYIWMDKKKSIRMEFMRAWLISKGLIGVWIEAQWDYHFYDIYIYTKHKICIYESRGAQPRGLGLISPQLEVPKRLVRAPVT